MPEESYRLVRLVCVMNTNQGPALMLSDEQSDQSFLIMILVQDADMISQILSLREQGVTLPVPTTYELFELMLEKFDARVSSVRITGITPEGRFCAELDMYRGDDYYPTTARVSDAIGLAVAFDVPILAAEEVFDRVNIIRFEVIDHAEPDDGIAGLPDGGLSPASLDGSSVLQTLDDANRDGHLN